MGNTLGNTRRASERGRMTSPSCTAIPDERESGIDLQFWTFLAQHFGFPIPDFIACARTGSFHLSISFAIHGFVSRLDRAALVLTLAPDSRLLRALLRSHRPTLQKRGRRAGPIITFHRRQLSQLRRQSWMEQDLFWPEEKRRPIFSGPSAAGALN